MAASSSMRGRAAHAQRWQVLVAQPHRRLLQTDCGDEGGGCTVVNGNGTSSSGIGVLIGCFFAFLIAIYVLRRVIACLQVGNTCP